jgi:hypothetical protein
MKCLNLSRIIAFRSELLSKTEMGRINEHLQSCNQCKKKLREFEETKNLLHRVLSLRDEGDDTGSLDDTQLLTFLAEDLPGRGRKEFYQELLKSPASLDQLISIEKMLNELKTNGSPEKVKQPELLRESLFDRFKNSMITLGQTIDSLFRIPRPVYSLVGIFLILMTFFFVLDHQQFISKLPFNTRESTIDDHTSTIQLLIPSNRSSVMPDQLRFNWTPVSNISSYNFILLNENGDIVWEQKTPTAGLTLPEDIRLKSSFTYFWQVECLFENGGSMLSEMASFSIINK